MVRRLSFFSSTGVSIVETMIALVVIVVGLAALRHAFPNNHAIERHASERVQAALLGKHHLEQLRMRGFPALATARFEPTPALFVDSHAQVVEGPFRWRAEVQHEAEDLLAVYVRVVWPWPAQTHQVELATYVSRHTP
ncbi:MAG: hypothetical protein FJZ47_14875 [Candidatus Tectomicrobia bacterium]|uniref:Prepilin-type N-terminal cleavage/methylation domain-containing protein n=1 Tax=Tectimicrobiota bacterium TaxID=2528274 RepID=A0A937W2L6_UNCTE|nr:hypothetical protein [Candidatus Tectomicrobia bacterium]